MSKLPTQYAWLGAERGPNMLLEALKEFGTVETPGPGDNPKILAWADEVAVDAPSAYTRWAANWYGEDSIPWCGLFMAVCAVRSNPDHRPDRQPPKNYLGAANWAMWGRQASSCPVFSQASLGDILVFSRAGGGHVGIYVGEGPGLYYVLGGNQGDKVSIAPIEKGRCIAVRRPAYINQPPNVRPIHLDVGGVVSKNEA